MQRLDFDKYYRKHTIGSTKNKVLINIFSNNTLDSNIEKGLNLSISANNLILNNNFTNNSFAVHITLSDKNILSKSNLSLNLYGIYLKSSEKNLITDNVLISNSYGIYSNFSTQNSVFHNSLINNSINGYDNIANFWDSGYEGNFWSDYIGIDSNNDDIGDVAYNINGGSGAQDRYPFIQINGWLSPPASVINLQNISYVQTYINWTWIDPADADLDHIEVYIDSSLSENVSKGTLFHSATGFAPDTEHTISTRTVDNSGNINQTRVNHTARTAPLPDTLPPAVANATANQSDIPDDTDSIP